MTFWIFINSCIALMGIGTIRLILEVKETDSVEGDTVKMAEVEHLLSVHLSCKKIVETRMVR